MKFSAPRRSRLPKIVCSNLLYIHCCVLESYAFVYFKELIRYLRLDHTYLKVTPHQKHIVKKKFLNKGSRVLSLSWAYQTYCWKVILRIYVHFSVLFYVSEVPPFNDHLFCKYVSVRLICASESYFCFIVGAF